MKLFSAIGLYLFMIFISILIGKTTLDFKNHIFSMKEPILFVVAITYGKV